MKGFQSVAQTWVVGRRPCQCFRWGWWWGWWCQEIAQCGTEGHPHLHWHSGLWRNWGGWGVGTGWWEGWWEDKGRARKRGVVSTVTDAQIEFISRITTLWIYHPHQSKATQLYDVATSVIVVLDPNNHSPPTIPTYVITVLDPNNPSASSNTRMASKWRASSNMASMFFVLSPTHLLSSSPQFTTWERRRYDLKLVVSKIQWQC